jgi:hypothetical protein
MFLLYGRSCLSKREGDHHHTRENDDDGSHAVNVALQIEFEPEPKGQGHRRVDYRSKSVSHRPVAALNIP